MTKRCQLITVLAITLLVVISSPVSALEIGGFDFRHDTLESVTRRLAREHIVYETDPPRALNPTLTTLIITSYPPFDRWGHLRWVELSFTPSGRLYRLTAEWRDTGHTFQGLVDSLVFAYGPGQSFSADQSPDRYQWNMGPVDIRVSRDSDPLTPRASVYVTNEQLVREEIDRDTMMKEERP